jgi:hypothetical protein
MPQTDTTVTDALKNLLATIQAGQPVSPDAKVARKAYAALGASLCLTEAETRDYLDTLAMRGQLAA